MLINAKINEQQEKLLRKIKQVETGQVTVTVKDGKIVRIVEQVEMATEPAPETPDDFKFVVLGDE